jgi:SAM-dependent methyltransferase
MARPRGFTALACAVCLVALVVSLIGIGSQNATRAKTVVQAIETPRAGPDVDFVPTPPLVVAKMLELARVDRGDLVYDLGCGDGRILFAAVKERGAQGVGIEIDPVLVEQCRARARSELLDEALSFYQADLFSVDFSNATVVTLYLLPHLNEQLVPQFQKLRPGTRIVSHAFGIDGYPADKLVVVPNENTGELHKVYYWVTPLEKGEGFVKR